MELAKAILTSFLDRKEAGGPHKVGQLFADAISAIKGRRNQISTKRCVSVRSRVRRLFGHDRPTGSAPVACLDGDCGAQAKTAASPKSRMWWVDNLAKRPVAFKLRT